MGFGALANEGVDGLVDGAVEVVGIGEGPVGEVVAFEVAPNRLDVVELGGVAGQPLDGEPGPAARALVVSLLVWIGPLSRTSTTGLVSRPGRGPRRPSDGNVRVWIDLATSGFGAAGARRARAFASDRRGRRGSTYDRRGGGA